MDGETFVKFILILVGVIIWILVKAAKKAQEEQETTQANPMPGSAERFLDKPLTKRENKNENVQNYSYEEVDIGSISTEIEKQSKTLIEKLQDTKDKSKIKDSPDKKDMAFLGFEKAATRQKNDKKTLFVKSVDLAKIQENRKKEVRNIDLDFNSKNLLTGIIFKEILEKRGAKSYFR